MPADRIRDLEQIQELLEMEQQFDDLKRILPVLKPLLQARGGEVSSLEEAAQVMEEVKPKLRALATVPDEFNDLFAERGWIIFGGLKFDVAERAVEAAKAQGVEAGEQVLVEYYDADTVDHHLTRMFAVEAFQDRMRLAREALEDYREGRYHATVPLVLALTDGLVNEVYATVHGERRGFFAEGADLTAWDSIAGHSSGLSALVEVLGRNRKKTRTEELTVPYRHGILHGMDLGFDNRMVAAKAWAALFAVREWALKAERGELDAPEEAEESVSLREAIAEFRRVRQQREKLEAWRARDIEVGEDIPAAGSPEDYSVDSPERHVVEFLDLWQQDNYGHMAKRVGILGEATPPHRISEHFGDTTLHSFRLLDVRDEAPARTEVDVELDFTWMERRQEKSKTFHVSLMHEDDGVPFRGDVGAYWTIGNWQAP